MGPTQKTGGFLAWTALKYPQKATQWFFKDIPYNTQHRKTSTTNILMSNINIYDIVDQDTSVIKVRVALVTDRVWVTVIGSDKAENLL